MKPSSTVYYFMGFLNKRLIFYDFFAQLKWSGCIYVYIYYLLMVVSGLRRRSYNLVLWLTLLIDLCFLKNDSTGIIICDWLWEKGQSRTHNDFSVVLRHLIFFGLAVSTTLWPHLCLIWGTENPSIWSSTLLKDGYLNLIFHPKNVVKRGWVGRKEGLKTDCVFKSLLRDALIYHCPVTPQLKSSHERVGPVYLPKRQSNRLSFNEKQQQQLAN